MKQKNKSLDCEPDPTDLEDVEILEVVGVEDDVPGGVDPVEPDRAPEFGEDSEIVLSFDSGDDRPAEDELSDATAGGASPDDASAEAGPAEGATDAAAVHPELVQRLRADYDNLRKRVARERHEFERHANGELISRLLPVLDNFDRALRAGAEGNGDALREGLIMIYNQMLESLRQEGLRPIETVERAFDPTLHDAVATDPSSSKPAHTVIEELRRGYLFRDRVLRPALVRVSTNGDHPDLDDEES